MLISFAFICVLVAAVLAGRQWLLYRVGPQRDQEEFDGVVYRVGKAAVAERRCSKPQTTVICMHGFVGSMQYFTDYYRDSDIQLILVNSCDYHLPIVEPNEMSAHWVRLPAATEGTIEYDAEVLLQALENLPRGQRVRVHGHSRGGAVVLEAASMRPDLFRKVEVLLEAPVLPGGRPHGTPSALVLWLLPFLVPLWRREPVSSRNRAAFGSLENPRKRHLIMGLPFNVRRVVTMITNLRSMLVWMQERSPDLFDNIREGVVLAPVRDKVLNYDAMVASAKAGAPHLQILSIPGCSHFPLFDRPDVIPRLVSRDLAPAANESRPALS